MSLRRSSHVAPKSPKGGLKNGKRPICVKTVSYTHLRAHETDSYLVPFRSYRSLLFKFQTLCVFEPPLGGLRDNVRCSSWAHWKACSGLPISVNWTFFARCYGWVATSEKKRKEIKKIGDFTPTRSLWSEISGRRGRPTNHFSTVS